QSRYQGEPAPGTTPSRLSLVSKVTTAFLAIGIGFLSVLPFYLIPLSEDTQRGVLRLNWRAIKTIFASHPSLGTGGAFIIPVAFALVGFSVAFRGSQRNAGVSLLLDLLPHP